MLRAGVTDIVFKDGKACGIKCGTEEARSKMIICDPSYVLKYEGKLKKTGQIIRSVLILDHPLPNTDNAESVQIIIPQKQIQRKNDIYIAAVSYAHAVCPKGLWIAIISTIVETDKPEVEI